MRHNIGYILVGLAAAIYLISIIVSVTSSNDADRACKAKDGILLQGHGKDYCIPDKLIIQLDKETS